MIPSFRAMPVCIGSLFRGAVPLFRGEEAMFRGEAPLFRGGEALFRGGGSLFPGVAVMHDCIAALPRGGAILFRGFAIMFRGGGALFRGVGPLFRGSASMFPGVAALERAGPALRSIGGSTGDVAGTMSILPASSDLGHTYKGGGVFGAGKRAVFARKTPFRAADFGPVNRRFSRTPPALNVGFGKTSAKKTRN
jgi:hypothetical protein